jgi:hypothetical protein
VTQTNKREEVFTENAPIKDGRLTESITLEPDVVALRTFTLGNRLRLGHAGDGRATDDRSGVVSSQRPAVLIALPSNPLGGLAEQRE